MPNKKATIVESLCSFAPNGVFCLFVYFFVVNTQRLLSRTFGYVLSICLSYIFLNFSSKNLRKYPGHERKVEETKVSNRLF